MVNTISKRPEVFLENLIFYVSLVLLMIVVGGFFGVKYLMAQKQLELDSVEEQLAVMKTPNQKSIEDQISLARRKLDDFAKAMKERRLAVNFFKNFETAVPDKIHYSNCDLDIKEAKVSLSGHAGDFARVGGQMARFSSSAAFAEINFERIGLGKESIDFNVKMSLDPKYLVSQ